MESTADVFASGLVFVGLTIAARPADKNHPYGHGRVETLTGLMLGFLLLAAGVFDRVQRGFSQTVPAKCIFPQHGRSGLF